MSINKAEMWEKLESVLSSEAVCEMKKLYTLFTPKMIDWFAGLYDPEIGGFYFSNSARDYETVEYRGKIYDLLPDAESTRQALGFFNSSGMVYGTGKQYFDVFPKDVSEKIVQFARDLQDPDGYFYHPQWGKEIGTSRRARDFNWCRGILADYGVSLKYPTILDNPKPAENTETLVPEHLSSLEAYKSYLDGLNLPENSYSGGNLLSCQGTQIKACGYLNFTIDYLNSLQHPETGLWHHTPNYYGVNGLMKISGVYNAACLPIPNAVAAANSAIEAIVSDAPVGAVVDLWNTWTAVNRIVISVRQYGGEQGIRDAEEIVTTLRKRAPEAIRRSYEKLAQFGKPDGGFSYRPDASCHKTAPTSQGMPVAIQGKQESDVNATVIASTLMVASMFSALELNEYKIPIYDHEDLPRVLALLGKKGK